MTTRHSPAYSARQTVSDRLEDADDAIDALEEDERLAVAVVGMAGRFPGAASVAELWRNLCSGQESIRRFEPDELLLAGLRADAIGHPDYVPAAPVLDGCDLFDAFFFGYSPRDAELMDPQHRIFLECAWHALEDAGHDTRRFPGKIGVFGGTAMNTYLLYSDVLDRFEDDYIPTLIGLDKDYLTTRVAYKLDLTGPAVTVQTACSSSLVATHLACQSLLDEECDMALIGGVSVRVPQVTGYRYQQGGVLSPEGRVRAFDRNAQGTIFGSGVGVCVLRRLEDALADGDTIHALILGSAINNDGSNKVDFTAPSVGSQSQVIAEALANAEVESSDIGYVETHGTGTVIGDQVELAALHKAFFSSQERGSCALGSIKTNIGHLDAAAGAAGLIKAVLTVEHGVIPPSLHCDDPHDEARPENGPFYVNTTLKDWMSDAGRPRRAGITSLGIGGTNAHVVLEEPPAPPSPSGTSRSHQLLLWSGRNQRASDEISARLAEHLGAARPALADAAFTLHVGRRAFEHRRTLVCQTPLHSGEPGYDDVITALRERDPLRITGAVCLPGTRRVAFMFPGGGAQYPTMARDLYREEAVFRDTVESCARTFAPYLSVDLMAVLYPESDLDSGGSVYATRPALALPALFTTEVALARLLQSWGVVPEALIGHSLGEYTAAHVAGVFSLSDACALVALRGRLFETLPAGAMLSTPLPASELKPLLGDDLSLAADNGLSFTVASGPIEAIESLQGTLAERGVEGRRVHIDVAAHSAMLAPIIDEFRAGIARMRANQPTIPVISNVTGTWLTARQAMDPDYWVSQLRHTVRFKDGLTTLLDEPNRVFIEVGPGQTLATFARAHPERQQHHWVVTTVRHPRDARHDLAVLLEAIGGLWLSGVEFDEAAFWAGQQRRRISLPGYPFERQRHWIAGTRSARKSTTIAAVSAAAHESTSVIPLDGEHPREHTAAERFWKPTWVREAGGESSEALGGRARRWLVFADRRGLGDSIVRRLRAAGQHVISVSAGAGFQRSSRGGSITVDEYVIAPASVSDMRALLDAMAKASTTRKGAPPADRVLWLWSMDRVGDDIVDKNAGEELVDDALSNHFFGPLALARVLAERAPYHQPSRLLMVAQGLHPVPGGARLDPACATLLGPCRVLSREVPSIVTSAVDVAPVDWECVADDIIAEALRDQPAPMVALRARERWLERYRAIELPGTSLGAPAPAIAERAVVLITGGLGGLGLACAEHLAATRRARLVLVSRSPLPPRHIWAQPGALSDRTRERIARIQSMEADGVEVLLGHADAADRGAMSAVISTALERFGAIDAVLHTAGVLADGAIVTKEQTSADAVLRPKVHGTLVLDGLLRERRQTPLMVLFSSINVHLAPFGQVDYVAANAFLDAFARRRALQAKTIAIDWPGWTETGMAARLASRLGVGNRESVVATLSHPLLARRLHANDSRSVGTERASAMYETRLDPAEHWVFAEHRVCLYPSGPETEDSYAPILPATAMIEMVRAGFADLRSVDAMALEDVFFVTPLVGDEPQTVRVLFHETVCQDAENERDVWEFQVVSRTHDTESWRGHAHGRICAIGPTSRSSSDADARGSRANLSELRARCPRLLRDAEWSWAQGVNYGPRWQAVTELNAGQDGFLARMEASARVAEDLEIFQLHPALLDVATAIGVHADDTLRRTLHVPYAYRRLVIYNKFPTRLYAYVERKASTPGGPIVFDGTLFDDHGVVLVAFQGFTLAAPTRPAVAQRKQRLALHVEQPGRLGSISLAPRERRAPTDGEVEVALDACGLNFKDVLHALDLLAPSDLFRTSTGQFGLGLGMEGAGRVLAVGAGVSDFQPGDRVMVQAPRCFAERVTVDARWCAHTPTNVSDIEAAALPVAYTTAIYALRHCAQLRPGERVLIHAATGGVGLAAVAVARARGAEILATSGTQEKRDYLREMGIQHVFDSRTLDFAEQVRAATRDEGVDVVLNSLGGEFIERSLSVLRPFGRFCELGLRDIISDRSLALGVFRKSITFYTINMEHMWSDRPGLLSELLTELTDDIRAGRLSALPVQVAPLEHAAEIFDTMAQAHHIGKFVLTPTATLTTDSVEHAQDSSVADEAPTLLEWSHALLYGHGPQLGASAMDPVLHNLSEGLSTAAGLDALERILASDEGAQLIVCPTDFVQRVRDFDMYFQERSFNAPQAAGQSVRGVAAASAHPRPDLSTPYVAPEGDIEETVAGLWAAILGIAEVGVHDRFAELGGDSLKGARVISSVNEQLGTSLSTTDFFAAPTVRALADLVQTEKQRENAAAYGQDSENEPQAPDKEATETSARADRRRELMLRRQRMRGRRGESDTHD